MVVSMERIGFALAGMRGGKSAAGWLVGEPCSSWTTRVASGACWVAAARVDGLVDVSEIGDAASGARVAGAVGAAQAVSRAPTTLAAMVLMIEFMSSSPFP